MALRSSGIGLVGAGALGGEVVARPEVDGVDVGLADEVGDLDLAGLLGLGALELLVGQDDVLAAAQVEAAGDVVVRHLLAGPLVDLLVADPVRGPLLELVEVDALVGRRRVQADGDVHQPEAESALPDGAWHGQQITSPDQVHHLVTTIRHTFVHGRRAFPRASGRPCSAGWPSWARSTRSRATCPLNWAFRSGCARAGPRCSRPGAGCCDIRDLIIEACGLDPATEPVPFVGRSPRNDVLNLVGYVGDLLRRAAAVSGRTVAGGGPAGHRRAAARGRGRRARRLTAVVPKGPRALRTRRRR